MKYVENSHKPPSPCDLSPDAITLGHKSQAPPQKVTEPTHELTDLINNAYESPRDATLTSVRDISIITEYEIHPTRFTCTTTTASFHTRTTTSYIHMTSTRCVIM